MHDVTLVYTEYNHRLEVWVLGKELLTQQLTGSSTQTQPCDNAMSMVHRECALQKERQIVSHLYFQDMWTQYEHFLAFTQVQTY